MAVTVADPTRRQRYFKAFFEEAGKAHYKLLESALKKLASRVLGSAGPDVVLLGTPGNLPAVPRYSHRIGVVANFAGGNSVRLVFMPGEEPVPALRSLAACTFDTHIARDRRRVRTCSLAARTSTRPLPLSIRRAPKQALPPLYSILTTGRHQTLIVNVTRFGPTCSANGAPLQRDGSDDRQIRRHFSALVAVATSMTNLKRGSFNPYPFTKLYEIATSHVTGLGATLEFQLDHLSANDNSAMRASKDAKRRMTGPNPINASTTVDSDDFRRFVSEMTSRKDEFTKTYQALSDWFIRDLFNGQFGPDVKPRKLIDGITFVTKGSYVLHEFRRDTPSSNRPDRFHFSLAPTPDGRDWAVHHLAGTGTGLPANSSRLSSLGVPSEGVDSLTYCITPVTD